MVQLFDQLKEFIKLDAKTRNLLIGYALLFLCIWYLYNQNSILLEASTSSNEKTEALIAKNRQSCEDQLEKNRAAYQEQFTNFVIKTNAEKDSTYKLFTKKLNIYEYKLRHNETILKELKDEMDK